MTWPMDVPDELGAGPVSLRRYVAPDAEDLVGGLVDERVWEHMSVGAPADSATLHARLSAKLEQGSQVTFTVRQHGQAVGVTSLVHDPGDPAGIEIGGTLLDPRVWGSGVNAEVKRLLLALCFDQGAIWVQLRTDVRNRRSAAAILKLGAVELEQRMEDHRRRDGTRRRSRVFRVEP